MRNSCRLLVSDMDGTLLDREGKVSEENRFWIERLREEGIGFTLASGRERKAMREVLEQLRVDAPYVCSNGSEVWHGDTLLERHLLAPEQIERLVRLSRSYGTMIEAYSTAGGFDRDGMPQAVEEYDWLQFVFKHPDPAVIRELTIRLAGEPLAMSQSDVTKLDINPFGVSKAAGAARAAMALGLDAGQVAAIGDNGNDLAMIRWAGIGIAPQNARDEVKAEADYVTAADHDRHAVAEAIRWLLGREIRKTPWRASLKGTNKPRFRKDRI